MFGKTTKAAELPRKSTLLPIKERLLAEAIGVEVEAAMLRALRQHEAETRVVIQGNMGTPAGGVAWAGDGR